MNSNKVAGQWDKADIIRPNDVTVGDDHVACLHEKGALRVAIRFLVNILADSDGREITPEEKQKIVECFQDIQEVMKGEIRCDQY